MTVTRIAALTAFSICLAALACMASAGEAGWSIQVANVKSILAIGASPTRKDVLFYGASDVTNADLLIGKLFKLRLDSAGENATPLNVSDTTYPPAPVWQPDGSAVYFETDDGIYQLSSSGGEPERNLERDAGWFGHLSRRPPFGVLGLE